MANQKIHEYPIERFVYGDDDYYDVDFWDGLVYQTAKIKGSVIKSAMLSGIAISLTAPSAFIVGGSPTDGTGTLTLTGAGLANQYIRGDGTLATFPTSGGGGNSVNYYLNGGTAASVALYYQMSKTAVIGTGVDFSLAGNGLISQWLTDVNDPNVTEIPAGNWNFEMYFSASSSGGTPAFYVELLKYDGATFTTIANNSATPEGITSGTAIDLYLTSVAVPLTALAVTDRLALRVYIVNSVIGRTIINHTQDSHLCQVITTFSSGVSSINGLTKQTQYLAVGTSGMDFAINSAIDTHTFNLPTASATNRGALSSANWSTFNGKQNAITLTTTGTGAATFIADTLNIPTASGGTPAGITGQIQFNNGGAFGADSGFFWDNTNKRLGIGATPATTVRLDVRAQGALSTDIAFRVRNSANNDNILSVSGNGAFTLGNNTGYYISLNPSSPSLRGYNAGNVAWQLSSWTGEHCWLTNNQSNQVQVGIGITTPTSKLHVYTVAADTSIKIGTGVGTVADETSCLKFTTTFAGTSFGGDALIIRARSKGTTSSDQKCSAEFSLNKDGTNALRASITSQSNLLLQAPTEDTSDIGVIYVPTGTAPTASIVDGFKQYSSDIVAGNAAPHFKTENGNVIKLYQETTAVGASTFVSNTSLIANDTATFDGYTIGQVVKALRNLGILA
jgi:hypothetical protein